MSKQSFRGWLWLVPLVGPLVVPALGRAQQSPDAQAPPETVTANPSPVSNPTGPEAPVPPPQPEQKPDEKKSASLVATAPESGFGLKSDDGAYALNIRGVLQADGRFFRTGGTNTFLVRKARPTLDGAVARYFDFRVTAELVSTPSALDVYGNVRLVKELQLRAGKFKSPLGLERLQNDPDVSFIERGLPTDLAPDRDVGVMLHGEVLDGTLAFALGVFNGAPDGGSADTDNSDKKDFAGRLFLRPFVPTKIEALRGVGLGIAATRGTQTGALARYASTNQVSFFQYADAAAAAGTHRRIAPQAYIYLGPVGILAEYTRSTQIVATSAATSAVTHLSWQVELNGFITGENASFGAVTPRVTLDPAKGRFGAIELAVRYGALEIDQDTFQLGFADLNKSARSAKEWAVGVNWHLLRSYKLEVNYEHVQFEGGGAKGTDRPRETAILTRLQAVF
jgi:phosphate-selective porin OprO/OprP